MSAPQSDASAPKLVGVVDIGANSIRMVIAQVGADRGMEVLERTQRAVRLGHDTFARGRLSQRAMGAALTVLRDCKKLLDGYKVESVRAVATSAVREAANADAFVDRVAMATGLDLEVLDPPEESRLTVSAVRQAVHGILDLSNTCALVAEVGGGSTLLTLLDRGIITASASYALGSVRLREHLAMPQEPQARAVDLLRHQIANVVEAIKRSMPLDRVQSLVAVGEEAHFAAQQTGQRGPSAEVVSVVEIKAFDRLVADCARLTAEKLSKKYGLPLQSTERLVPAFLVYHGLLHATPVDRMAVCDVSMRDGLLLDMVRRATGEDDPELVESVAQSARTIGEKYRYDPRHAEHVGDLAIRLFDELQREHGLTPRHRLLLRVAATLHEVGGFVSNRAHHKHSYYLIANSEIFGLRREEVQVAAHVARYHRRAVPKPTHIEFLTLPREDRIAVNKLAAILRVADALDRGHAQQVRDFHVERRQGELVLYVRGVSDLTLERRATEEKGDLFEDTYGLKVRVEEDVSPAAEPRRASPVE
ncbi:MAG TPA: Ppx/GppA phosphatase family protein [Planctomycetota bacterium]|nr:Ppx/GppA phosphatase family protein [Planctomycetota bacterium]